MYFGFMSIGKGLLYFLSSLLLLYGKIEKIECVSNMTFSVSFVYGILFQ